MTVLVVSIHTPSYEVIMCSKFVASAFKRIFPTDGNYTHLYTYIHNSTMLIWLELLPSLVTRLFVLFRVLRSTLKGQINRLRNETKWNEQKNGTKWKSNKNLIDRATKTFQTSTITWNPFINSLTKMRRKKNVYIIKIMISRYCDGTIKTVWR